MKTVDPIIKVGIVFYREKSAANSIERLRGLAARAPLLPSYSLARLIFQPVSCPDSGECAGQRIRAVRRGQAMLAAD